MSASPPASGLATLCIDVGGSAVKGGTVGPSGALLAEPVRLVCHYPVAPADLLAAVAAIGAQSPPASRVAIGFPGMVRAGLVLSAPHYITTHGPGTDIDPELLRAWTRYGLAAAVSARLGLPCRLANDADVQGLAAITGAGLEVVITLGTGFGSALFLDGQPAPHLELAHHPLQDNQTYNERVGNAALLALGPDRWSQRVEQAVSAVQQLVFYDRLFIGGGNAGHLTAAFGHEATIVPNADGILGGARLWTLDRLP